MAGTIEWVALPRQRQRIKPWRAHRPAAATATRLL